MGLQTFPAVCRRRAKLVLKGVSSFSSSNLLELTAGGADADFAPSPRQPPRLPCLVTGDSSAEAGDSPFSPATPSPDRVERRIIVTHRLPLRVVTDARDPLGLAFSWDTDALALQRLMRSIRWMETSRWTPVAQFRSGGSDDDPDLRETTATASSARSFCAPLTSLRYLCGCAHLSPSSTCVLK